MEVQFKLILDEQVNSHQNIKAFSKIILGHSKFNH